VHHVQDLRRNRRRLVEVEEKRALSESQMGFRKGRLTLDNIYILNYIVQKEKMKMDEEKKVYPLFIDLRAAFDSGQREIMEDFERETD